MNKCCEEELKKFATFMVRNKYPNLPKKIIALIVNLDLKRYKIYNDEK